MLSNLALLRIVYFFSAQGPAYVGLFLPLIFDKVGTSSLRIGVIHAVGPVSSVVISPILCIWFDRRKDLRKALYLVSSLVGNTVYCSVPFLYLYAPEKLAFPFILVALIFQNGVGGAVVTLLDAISVEAVKQNECKKERSRAHHFLF